MDFRDIHKSQTVRGILMGIGIAVIALLIFQAGQVVGYRKARFAGNFGNNFERNFLGPRSGGTKVLWSGSMPGGHGAVGEIMTINLPQIIVVGPDNIEKVVIVGTTTQVRHFQEEIRSGDLKIGDFIVVLGSPNGSGQIEAKLIRIIPAPTEKFTRVISR